MTYEQALDTEVTAWQAKKEIEAHGHTFEEFADTFGYRASYSGSDVLGWLGY